MMVIRPIEAKDAEALDNFAKITGPGFTSLQDDPSIVEQKLNAALKAFQSPQNQQENLFLFVLEDIAEQKIAGICAIESAVGLSAPWYNYRLGTLVHASKELDVYNTMQTLTISNDNTGCSELCTLFLHPDYRHSRNGHLLSKSRFMFMAEFPQLFSDTLVAEMRGFSDENGVSPFWEGLGKHFFSLEFTTADKLSSIGKAFIAELMPKYPLYTQLLPKSAQDVIGHTHKNTIPARKLLEREGMRFGRYVDIFDAGPTLEANVKNIRAIKDSYYVKVKISHDDTDFGDMSNHEQYLISCIAFEKFRCTLTILHKVNNNLITIPSTTAEILNITDGSTVRIVPLIANKGN